MADKHHTGFYQEESPLRMLSVKIIRAINIPWADWMSNADCYVCLWVPTCTNKVFKTKTAANTSAPEWKETFQFKICDNVKNVIELTLHDEDVISGNDLLYTVFFDVAKVPLGQTLKKIFPLKPEGQEKLEVEFKMSKIPAHPEKIQTNGVLVSREMSCLDVCVDKQKIPRTLQGRKLVLKVEDSCEKRHKMMLDPVTGSNHKETRSFHCIKKWEPELNAHLEGGGGDGFLTVPMKSLHVGREEKVILPAGLNTPLKLKLKAKECNEDLDIRMGYDICEDERAFLRNRSKFVAAALKRVLKLERDLEEHEIPVIAVTTTGGGTRAMTSLYGTLSGLKKLDLLDCVSYVTGASGSTWAISNLYEDPEWSQKDLDKLIQNARRNVTKEKTSAFSLGSIMSYWEELKKRREMGYKTSFTDIWGLIIEAIYHDEVKKSTLSDQRKALSRGQNPLPLCLAMNVKDDDTTTLNFKEWCEFSPYEVGILKYGAFIRSEYFGSSFFMGRLTKKLPESRMCFLEALWSNIFSINLMDAWFLAVNSNDFWDRFTQDNIHDLEEEEAERRKRESPSLATRLLQPSGFITNVVRDILTSRPLDAEHHNFLRGLQIHKNYTTHEGFCCFEDSKIDRNPSQLTPFTEDLCLVDSGYYINASFPPLLRKERKVDIILSFDYGLGAKFNSVKKTHKYCKEQKIPFPNIELSEEDQQHPKECHVFSDAENPEAPIILHFPLVNDTFREYKAPGVKRRAEEMNDGMVPLSGRLSPYSLVKLTYSEEHFDQLLNLAEYNVLNNEEIILQALRDAIARKQKSRSTGTN